MLERQNFAHCPFYMIVCPLVTSDLYQSDSQNVSPGIAKMTLSAFIAVVNSITFYQKLTLPG